MPELGDLLHGKFLERPNRFLAVVELPEEGQVEVHVPNSGRLKELLLPGAPVLLRYVPGKVRKTEYDLILVGHQAAEKFVYVSVDTRLPGPVFMEGLTKGIPASLQGSALERPEVKFLRSRLDFRLKGKSGKTIYVEVKSVTLVEEGKALFPDAPSLRGSRHLEDLMQAASLGYEAAVVFVIQRSDAVSFSPNDLMDPLFGKRLRQAAKRGVSVSAYSCKVGPERVTPYRDVPVVM